LARWRHKSRKPDAGRRETLNTKGGSLYPPNNSSDYSAPQGKGKKETASNNAIRHTARRDSFPPVDQAGRKKRETLCWALDRWKYTPGLYSRPETFQYAVTDAGHTSVLAGLIPNCAASVAITEVYLKGGITFGSAVAGLSASGGLGMLVLLKENKGPKENALVIGLLALVSFTAGILLNLFV
jgi:hypothetical protein